MSFPEKRVLAGSDGAVHNTLIYWIFPEAGVASVPELFSANCSMLPRRLQSRKGRVVLAAISLVGVAIDPTEPPGLAFHVQTTLILYAIYGLAVLALLHWRVIHQLGGTLTHTVDVVVVTALLVLSDGFSSPFLVFFTFVLLAASLRWDWQGIAATTAALTLLAVAVAIFDFSLARQNFDLKETIIRVAYLIVTATLLGYASAHQRT